jgi:hypothetical protein
MANLVDACRVIAPAEGKASEIGQPTKIRVFVMNATCRKA